jgi:DNA-binding response OmpR family regulator
MAATRAEARGSRTVVPQSLDGMRVLVVEDRTDLRELFAALLACEGADVSTAGTGRDAIGIASARSFDAVLCDLGLPDLHGEVVVRELLRGTTRPPAVAVVTGHDEPHLTRAKAAGAEAAFRKPVEWAHIRLFLRRVRDRQGLRAGRAAGLAAG